jgi:tetratricopeptide (TPR) repeat protein
MHNAVTRILCWMAMAIVFLGSAGCRDDAGRLNKKARKAFMAADQEEAVRLFNRALTLDPGNLTAHLYLGWIYEMQGRVDEGITEFRKAIEAHPNHDGSYFHLGGLYLAKGMLDEAIEALNKAVILNPDAANAHYQLGIAYRRKGNTADAAGAFFDAGLLSVVKDNKDLAADAQINLKEMGHLQLAGELQGVLSSWFDPATEAIKPSAGGRVQE